MQAFLYLNPYIDRAMKRLQGCGCVIMAILGGVLWALGVLAWLWWMS